MVTMFSKVIPQEVLGGRSHYHGFCLSIYSQVLMYRLPNTTTYILLLLTSSRLSFMEHEFKSEYQELRKQCQDFATALLDHTRSSYELEVLLNHDPTGPAFEHGDRMHLNRLKLAIKLRQKKVITIS